MPRYLASCHYLDSDLGPISLAVRSNATQFTARWRNGALHVSIPRGTTEEKYREVLEKMKPQLLAMKPQEVAFAIGRVYESDLLRIRLVASERMAGGYFRIVVLHPTDVSEYAIECDPKADFASPGVISIINKMMTRIAVVVAPAILPRAREIARQLGCKPRSWDISRGQRTLGRCSRSGDICLSAMMVFMPPELRDYVVCHELAHLTEMNHSERFHAICNEYCGGREAELEARLRSFRFPNQFRPE